MIPENETKNWSEIDEDEQKDKKLNKDASPFIPSNQINEKEEISIITEQGDKNSNLEKVSDFSLLGLHPLLLKGVIEVKGFNKPSKIQEYALPIMIGTDKNKPQNFIGQAKAGSGKTAAFVLGMFSHIDVQVKAPQGIIVCPTRELSVQVFEEVNKFGKFLIEQEGMGVFLAVPKDDKNSNDKKSRDNKPIKDTVIVGTPGKLMDLIKNKTIDVKNIKVLVLDEADFVLSAMVDTIKRIRYEIQKQTKPFIYLFSATFPQRVRDFAKEFVNKPYKHLYLNLDELNIEEILQYKVDCISNNSDKRLEIIQIVFRCITSTKMIVFFNRKDELDKVEKKLRNSGFDDIFVVHGNLDNNERETNMLKFKEAPKGILITTNVLARGIDVEGVNVVINYDLPVDHEKFKQGLKVEDIDTYLHRVGRTGRFGYSGIAINLIADKDDTNIMKNIEKKLEAKIQTLDEKDIQERLEKDEEIVEKKNEKRKDEIKNHHYDQYK